MPSLLIFARAPVAGRCKTRLIPRLGARGAAWVQKRLIVHLLETGQVVQASVPELRLVLSCSPSPANPFFRRCAQHYGAQLRRQPRGDLGRKMRRATAAELPFGPVLLVGSDAFWLEASDLAAALQALSTRPYFLTPALDGGYVQIAAQKRLPSLTGIAWSSGRELQQTTKRLAANGGVTLASEARGDFDTAFDWRCARKSGRMPALTLGTMASRI